MPERPASPATTDGPERATALGPARLVGVNHVALEVGSIDRALEVYGRLFEIRLRGRVGDRMAFVDMGDQFLALTATEAAATSPADGARHLGLVVDDVALVRAAAEACADVEVLPGDGLDLRDPWGNRLQLVQYDEVQFTKAQFVLDALGLEELGKTPEALAELRERGLLRG